jgi:[acyl-carrier-protein] S-malonyltransferase
MSVAVVFPGQGSQVVGMLKDIAELYPEVEATFAIASSVLGYDLWRLVQQGPAEELDKTMHTQPALLTASYVLWNILTSKKKIIPAFLAGHSLGEYTALVCANALSFTDALSLVAARGRYMQEAVPVGQSGLAAIIGLDDVSVQKLCETAVVGDEVLSLANFNCPGQVVIGGHLQAVQRALVLAKAMGARLAKMLPVSVSSHCALMKPAAEKLAQRLTNTLITQPTIPVINNVDVKIYDSPDSIRDGLIRQLYNSVRWVEVIQLMVKHNVTHIIECGPGKVLTGLNKRIVSDLQLTSTADAASLQVLLETSFSA